MAQLHRDRILLYGRKCPLKVDPEIAYGFHREAVLLQQNVSKQYQRVFRNSG
jgi:hypothetical protein